MARDGKPLLVIDSECMMSSNDALDYPVLPNPPPPLTLSSSSSTT